MRVIVCLLLALGCGKPAVMPHPATSLAIEQPNGLVRVQMSADGTILDGNGSPIGSVDDRQHSITIRGTHLPLAGAVLVESLRAIEVRLPIGDWHLRIDEAGALSVDSTRYGRVRGYQPSSATTSDAWRIGALFVAMGFTEEARPVDAGVPDAWKPEPPPPPLPGGPHARSPDAV